MLGNSIDKLVIARYIDTTQLGFFDKAQGFAKMPFSQITSKLGMVSFSAISRLQGDSSEIKAYLNSMMTLISLISWPVFFGLALVSENFILVLLGEKWIDSAPVLSILSISYVALSLQRPIASANIALGNIKQQSFIRLFGLIIFITILLWKVEQGIIFISYLFLFFNIFLLIFSFLLLKKEKLYSWRNFYNSARPAIITTIFMCTIVSLSQHYLFQNNSLLNLLISIILGILSYGVSILIIPYKEWEFLRLKIIKLFLKNK